MDTNQRAANPVLLYIYLACFYVSLAFPWNQESGAIYGINIGGFTIEPHLFLILIVLFPFYLISGSTLHSLAMRRCLFVCRLISITCGTFFLFSFFLASGKSSGLQAMIMPLIDVKTWFLFWMMPVTVLYIHDRGLDRWICHFFAAMACYCALAIVVLKTPYGWGANFVSLEKVNIYGRITMENDILLILAVPLAVAWLQDHGFSILIIICLGLYFMKLAIGQGRTLMAFSAFITLIVILRGKRLGRGLLTISIVLLVVVLTVVFLPEQQKMGITGRLSGLEERIDKYYTMLVESNRIAFEQISGDRLFFGAGVGTSLDLYGGGDAKKASRMYVDNLWVTLLFKFGIIGFFIVGGTILWSCWSSARGHPLSSVDRVFKWWAFMMPVLSLRGSFLMWNTTAGVIWATLAVSVVMAERRRNETQAQLLDIDEYAQEEYVQEELVNATRIYF